MPTRREIIARIETPLTALYGEREARQIARIVVMELGGLCLTDLVAEPDKELGIDELDRIIGELAAGRPLQYVLGHTEFYGLDFQVREGVLIPRPETEELVRWIAESPAPDNPAVLDVGTGSGCIAVTIALDCPKAQVWACDKSKDALSVAKCNAEVLGAKVTFVESDWFSAFADEKFDLIVSNPPYIEENDEHLKALCFEPVSALTSGADGLNDIRTLAAQAPEYIRGHGGIIVEHGYNQGESVAAIFRTAGFASVRTVRDFGDNPRLCCAVR